MGDQMENDLIGMDESVDALDMDSINLRQILYEAMMSPRVPPSPPSPMLRENELEQPPPRPTAQRPRASNRVQPPPPNTNKKPPPPIHFRIFNTKKGRDENRVPREVRVPRHSTKYVLSDDPNDPYTFKE